MMRKTSREVTEQHIANVGWWAHGAGFEYEKGKVEGAITFLENCKKEIDKTLKRLKKEQANEQG